MTEGTARNILNVLIGPFGRPTNARARIVGPVPDEFDREPDLGYGPEPSLRKILQRYYQTGLGVRPWNTETSEEFAERYIEKWKRMTR